ncbi:MAG: N-6 DNA methylase [Desulfurococcaceae archaeon]
MSLERTQINFAHHVVNWINEIIKEERLKFRGAEPELKEVGVRRDRRRSKRPDVVLFDAGGRPALVIEIWDPSVDPWDYAVEVMGKAGAVGAPYFVVWNVTDFYSWSVAPPNKNILEKLWWPHAGVREHVCQARNYEEAVEKYRDAIKDYLRVFLREFEKVYYGVKELPLLNIDERFIYRLRSKIYTLSTPVIHHVKRRMREDPQFSKGLRDYFVRQGWVFTGSDEDLEKVSHQYVYLLVNKILFYNVLRATYKEILPAMIIPETVRTGEELRERLDEYFRRAWEVSGDYETILFADTLDSIVPPDETVEGIRNLVRDLDNYDFTGLNYEVLGNVFQRLIPEDERHKLGQYFTRSDVVDLIVGFCVRDGNEKVIDGAVGAGTFLVRAYVRKKLLRPEKKHTQLLEELYGVDMAKFPAHLTIINLASRDLSRLENYPRIIVSDFFDVKPETSYDWKNLIPREKEQVIETLSRQSKLLVTLPKQFDAVVMNPPYTRQEEMEDLLAGEKEKAYRTCINDWKSMSRYPKEREPRLSKRASIYVYFFIHGGRLLREGGRMGFITSNSWLDVDYGYDLQRFFLENFKVVAVIESKVERWFEDADINTAITILERCSDQKERDDNLVKFVQLKKPLSELIPPAKDEKERWSSVEKLVKLIENVNHYFEDDKIRIYVKKQRELWDEGFNEETGEYEGTKWGKYLRAPPIFFKILEKGKNILVPLKEVAEVRFGIKTGANEFFYLTEEEITSRWGIEKEFWMHPVTLDEWLKIRPYIPDEDVWVDKNGEYFKQSQYSKQYRPEEVLIDGNVIWVPNYVIKSPRECKSILVNPKDLKYRVLLIHKDKPELRGTRVLKYIEWGEAQGFHRRPTCESRQRWYDLSEVIGDLLCMMSINDRHIFWYNVPRCCIDARLYGINIKDKEFIGVLSGILNSTIFTLFIELWGRVNLGQGALDVKVYEYSQIPIINPSKLNMELRKRLLEVFSKMGGREIGSVFEEIGADSPEGVSLDKVKPDRRELDKIVMGEILGLSEEEQLEVYRAVVDLVRSRLERARSAGRRRGRSDVEIDKLVSDVLRDLEVLYGIKVLRFPEDYVGDAPVNRVVEVPRGSRIEYGVNLLGPYVKIDDVMIRCESVHEAKYLAFAAIAGKTSVGVPQDTSTLIRAVEERERHVREAQAILEGYLNEVIPDKKVREAVRYRVAKHLGIPIH